MPVEVAVSTTLGDIYFKTLSWDELKGVGGDSNLFKVLATEVTDFKQKNAISLPSAMLDVFPAWPMKDPTSLAMAFLDAITSYDMEHKNKVPARQKYGDEFRHLIQFCWLAKKKETFSLLPIQILTTLKF